MEWIKARGALKSSFFSEISMLSVTQQQHDDGVFGFATTNTNVTCGDDFCVDELLDFSDKDFEENSFQESEEDETKDSFSESSQERSFVDSNYEFRALPEGELSVPVDEIDNLEWLSQFVDDSGTEVSLLCHGENFKEKNRCFVQNRSKVIIEEPWFSSPVCRKPRGKRARPSSRIAWRFGRARLPWFLENREVNEIVTSESSTLSSSSHGFSTVSTIQESDLFFSLEKPTPTTKKQKKKATGEIETETDSGSYVLRRCTHCQVQKTPQWRSGPLGPKTLCNACGVRFKSGRLFPEYRPACSPTFSQKVHSNSHRKVLEMREKKAVAELPDAGAGLTPMVSNC